MVERLENSDFYGFFVEVQTPDLDVARGNDAIGQLHEGLRQIASLPCGGTRSVAPADF